VPKWILIQVSVISERPHNDPISRLSVDIKTSTHLCCDA